LTIPCAITVVAFALVAVVQLAFGRSIGPGAIRSANFASWIVAALATQAQIGRTASGGQPVAIQTYFQLLKVFEVNPDAALPSECIGAADDTAISAMLLSTALVLLFAALSVPCVTAPVTALTNKARDAMRRRRSLKVHALLISFVRSVLFVYSLFAHHIIFWCLLLRWRRSMRSIPRTRSTPRSSATRRWSSRHRRA
jgi:hypothetical protein